MLGAVLFASVFVAAGSEATRGSRGRDRDDRSTGDIFADAVMGNVTNVASQMIERNLNIAPTLRILPGYRFSIITTRDIAFAEPYVVPAGGSR
jgi:type IV secretion system protein VirB10